MKNLAWRCCVALMVVIIPGSYRVWFLRKFGVLGGVGKKVLFSTTHLGTEPGLIFVGDNTVIAAGVRFVTHDLSPRVLGENSGVGDLFGEIRIGSNCSIGADVIILPGVSIVDRVIVGAGSIVTKSIESSGVYVGVGPKHVATLDEFKQRSLERQARGLALGDRHIKKFKVVNGKLVKRRPFV